MKVSESSTQETKISLAKAPREFLFSLLSLSKSPPLRIVSRPRLYQPPVTWSNNSGFGVRTALFLNVDSVTYYVLLEN